MSGNHPTEFHAGASEKPRKLLIYTHAMAGGGAERACAVLASGFAQRGYRVILAVDFEAPANLSYLGPGVSVVVLGQGHGRAVIRLARLLSLEKPDFSLSAIGVSNLKHVLAAALSGRLRHAILSYHAYFVSEPELLSRLAYCATPLLSRLTARTVAVSQNLRDYLKRTWRSQSHRTVTIYNAVTVSEDTTPAPPNVADLPLVLAAGRLTPAKNMLGLVRAFASAVETTPARMIIIGEGPEREALETEILRLGLAHRVSVPGYQSEPWKLYRGAACFVTASLVETFSMVVAEALAFGLPVVAVDSAGPREVLADGRYGTLVPRGDQEALARAIVAAIAAPGDGEERRKRAAVFSLDAALDAYQRLFDEIEAEDRHPRRIGSMRRP